MSCIYPLTSCHTQHATTTTTPRYCYPSLLLLTPPLNMTLTITPPPSLSQCIIGWLSRWSFGGGRAGGRSRARGVLPSPGHRGAPQVTPLRPTHIYTLIPVHHIHPYPVIIYPYFGFTLTPVYHIYPPLDTHYIILSYYNQTNITFYRI